MGLRSRVRDGAIVEIAWRSYTKRGDGGFRLVMIRLQACIQFLRRKKHLRAESQSEALELNPEEQSKSV